MTKLEPDRIQRFEDHTFSITLIVLVVIAVLGGGFLYWYFLAQSVHAPVRAGMEDARGQDYSTIYAQLGIKQLPPNIERQPQIRNRLDQLSREPCYLNAIIGFADALLQAGYPRETDTSLLSFTRHCGGPDEILVRRYTALSQASDFSAAFPIVDQLVRSDPASAQVRYWRGLTYEKLNKFDRALTDYINSVQLLGDPVRVSVNMFYDISRMYVALGRYCDAITPMETYISFDPANRRTTQYTKLISEFADKGNCDAHYARGSARVSRLPLPGMTGVNTLAVTVNGVTGHFLLDTGATYVAVTPEFATKAKIAIEPSTQLSIKTVGGSGVADLAYATTIAVDNAEARGVAVAVIRGAPDPFGRRLDGLLGMSFLARFNVRLSQSGIELTAIPLR